MKVSVPNPNWVGDKFDRELTGRFVYDLIMWRYSRHVATDDSKALCVAIDADWGAGKSFFVRRWSKDIEGKDHIVVRFDAWKSDLSDDPLVAFLTQFERDLEPWIKALPVANKIRQKGRAKLLEVLAQGRKAALPAAAHLIKGLLEHYAPGALASISAELGLEIDADTASEKASVGALSGTALKQFLADSFKASATRRSAVDGLKASIESLVTFLDAQQKVRLPLFVFVDELDRCRPDYAIRLLECVKHLFDAPNVCFVFSTNIKQLSESVKAVYGSEFDGRRYLKRFFSFEYLLPTHNPTELVRDLVQRSDILARKLRVYSGLPARTSGQADPTSEEELTASVVLVASAFSLSPRSVEQVFAYADATASVLEAPTSGSAAEAWAVHATYLFFLAALLHEGGEAAYDDFCSTTANRQDLLRRVGVSGEVRYERRDANGELTESPYSHADLFVHYHDYSKKSLRELLKAKRSRNRAPSFPQNIEDFLAGELGSGDSPSIRSYALLVRNAGGLRL